MDPEQTSPVEIQNRPDMAATQPKPGWGERGIQWLNNIRDRFKPEDPKPTLEKVAEGPPEDITPEADIPETGLKSLVASSVGSEMKERNVREANTRGGPVKAGSKLTESLGLQDELSKQLKFYDAADFNIDPKDILPAKLIEEVQKTHVEVYNTRSPEKTKKARAREAVVVITAITRIARKLAENKGNKLNQDVLGEVVIGALKSDQLRHGDGDKNSSEYIIKRQNYINWLKEKSGLGDQLHSDERNYGSVYYVASYNLQQLQKRHDLKNEEMMPYVLAYSGALATITDGSDVGRSAKLIVQLGADLSDAGNGEVNGIGSQIAKSTMLPGRIELKTDKMIGNWKDAGKYGNPVFDKNQPLFQKYSKSQEILFNIENQISEALKDGNGRNASPDRISNLQNQFREPQKSIA